MKTILFISKNGDIEFLSQEIRDNVAQWPQDVGIVDSLSFFEVVLNQIDQDESVRIIVNANLTDINGNIYIALDDQLEELGTVLHPKAVIVKNLLQLAKKLGRKIESIIFVNCISGAGIAVSPQKNNGTKDERESEMQAVLDEMGEARVVFVGGKDVISLGWEQQAIGALLHKEMRYKTDFAALPSILVVDRTCSLQTIKILESQKTPFKFSTSIAKIAGIDEILQQKSVAEINKILVEYYAVQIEELYKYISGKVLSDENKYKFRNAIETNLGNILNKSFLLKVFANRERAVDLFLKNRAKLAPLGFDINATDQNGWCAVAIACRSGRRENIFQSLLQVPELDVNAIHLIDGEEKTPLHIACEEGRLDAVEKLFLRQDLRPWTKSYQGETALSVSVRKFAEAQTTEAQRILYKLIDSQKDIGVNEWDKEGDTVLTFCCRNYPDFELIKRLCDQRVGVDVKKYSKDEFAPLSLACINGHVEIARYLVDEKDALSCEINNYNHGLFNFICAKYFNLEILEIIWPKVAASVISEDSISFEILIDSGNIAALKFVERKIVADVSQYDLYDLQIKLQNSVNFITGLEVEDAQRFAAINESLKSMQSALEGYRRKLRLENSQTIEGLVYNSEDEFEAAYREAACLGGDGSAGVSASSINSPKSGVEAASGRAFVGRGDDGRDDGAMLE